MADVRATAELDVEVNGRGDLEALQRKLDALSRDRKGRITIEEAYKSSKQSGARERALKAFSDDKFSNTLKDFRHSLAALANEESELLKTKKYSQSLANSNLEKEQSQLVSEIKSIREGLSDERADLPRKLSEIRSNLDKQRQGLESSLSSLHQSFAKNEAKIASQKKPVKALERRSDLENQIKATSEAITNSRENLKSSRQKILADNLEAIRNFRKELADLSAKDSELMLNHRKRISDLNNYTSAEQARISAERENLSARKRQVEKEYSSQRQSDNEVRLNRQLTNQALEKYLAKSREIAAIEKSGRFSTDKKGFLGSLESIFGTRARVFPRRGGVSGYTRGPFQSSENFEDPMQAIIGSVLLFSKIAGTASRAVVATVEMISKAIATVAGLGAKLNPIIGMIAAVAAPVAGAIGSMAGFIMIMKTVARVINVAIIAVSGLVTAVVGLVAAARAAKQAEDLNYQAKLQRLDRSGMLSSSMLAGLTDGSLTSGIEAVTKFNELLRKELTLGKDKKGVAKEGNEDLSALGLGQKQLREMKKTGELSFPRIIEKMLSDFTSDTAKAKSPEKAQAVLASYLERIRKAFGDDIAKLFLNFAEQSDPIAALRERMKKNESLSPDLSFSALDKFLETFNDMKMRLGNAFSTLGSDLAPALTRGIEALEKVLEDNKEPIRKALADSMGGVIESITNFIKGIDKNSVDNTLKGFSGFMAGVRDGFAEAITFIQNLAKAIKAFLEFTGILTPGDPNNPKSQEKINSDIERMNYDFKKFMDVMSGFGSAVEVFTSRVPALTTAFDNLVAVIDRVASAFGVDEKSRAEQRKQTQLAAPQSEQRASAYRPQAASSSEFESMLSRLATSLATRIVSQAESLKNAISDGAPKSSVENQLSRFNREFGIQVQTAISAIRQEQSKLKLAGNEYDADTVQPFNDAADKIKTSAQEAATKFNELVGTTLAQRATEANNQINGSAMLAQASAIGAAIGQAFASVAGSVKVGVGGVGAGGAATLNKGTSAPTGGN